MDVMFVSLQTDGNTTVYLYMCYSIALMVYIGLEVSSTVGARSVPRLFLLLIVCQASLGLDQVVHYLSPSKNRAVEQGHDVCLSDSAIPFEWSR